MDLKLTMKANNTQLYTVLYFAWALPCIILVKHLWVTVCYYIICLFVSCFSDPEKCSNVRWRTRTWWLTACGMTDFHFCLHLWQTPPCWWVKFHFSIFCLVGAKLNIWFQDNTRKLVFFQTSCFLILASAFLSIEGQCVLWNRKCSSDVSSVSQTQAAGPPFYSTGLSAPTSSSSYSFKLRGV